jgi:serine acetyltransferase
VLSLTVIRSGAALGANSTIICGHTIGRWALIGSGSVVSRDIPDYGLAWGNPARLHGFVCPCGTKLEKVAQENQHVLAECPKCKEQVKINLHDWEQIT